MIGIELVSCYSFGAIVPQFGWCATQLFAMHVAVAARRRAENKKGSQGCLFYSFL
jgi:hypothetical protein